MPSIQDSLNQHAIDFLETGHHHCRTGWIQIKNCPFCHSQNFHLGWNIQLRYVSCWKCGTHHPAHTLQKLGLTRQEAEEVARSASPDLGFKRERSRISLKEPAGRKPILPPHARYLENRGYDPAEISRIWNVESIGLASRLRWRIYIPIIYLGERVSWTTRTIGDAGLRYVSASAEEEAMNHKELVYGIDFCQHSVVICEGPMDAWKIGPGACALFGTAYTTAQVKMLIGIPNRFICFDSSPDAQRQARQLAQTLSCFPGRTENFTIDAKDPGEASQKEIQQIRKAARL